MFCEQKGYTSFFGGHKSVYLKFRSWAQALWAIGYDKWRGLTMSRRSSWGGLVIYYSSFDTFPHEDVDGLSLTRKMNISSQGRHGYKSLPTPGVKPGFVPPCRVCLNRSKQVHDWVYKATAK